MAHILCITSGLTGILHASFEVAARLEAVGHQVTLASPKEVGARVRLQGFDYVQLAPTAFDPAPPLPLMTGPLQKLKRIVYKATNYSDRKEAAIQNLGMEVFQKKLETLSPDFILIDIELHEHLMTAYVNRWPMSLLSQWFSLWNRQGLPPLVQDTIPGKGWQGSSWGISWAWWKIKWQRKWMFGKKKLLSVGTDRKSILRAYANRINFPPRYIKNNYWPGPFTYAELPVISMTAQELEFPHPIRPNLHYVGPMVFAKRKENLERAENITSILAEAKKKNKVIIYASVSTFKKGDQTFLKKIISAVGTEKNWVLIVGLGGKMDRTAFKQIPENVFIFSWVPQLLVLAKADCSINHGGIHTLNECIHFKVPVLVFSGKRSDQDGCAARVAYHEVGIMADKDDVKETEIKEKIVHLLSNDTFRKNMELLHKSYRKYHSENRLNKVISQMIDSHKKRPISTPQDQSL